VYPLKQSELGVPMEADECTDGAGAVRARARVWRVDDERAVRAPPSHGQARGRNCKSARNVTDRCPSRIVRCSQWD
jgi:hypothetical protein